MDPSQCDSFVPNCWYILCSSISWRRNLEIILVCLVLVSKTKQIYERYTMWLTYIDPDGNSDEGEGGCLCMRPMQIR